MSRSARAYAANDYEPVRPPSLDGLPLWSHTPGEAARDRVLAGFEAHRATVVQALRAEAHRLYRELRRPLSANDIRPLLARLKYEGDPRILVAAFPLRAWAIVGETRADGPKNHARRIRTFVPRGSA